MLFASPSRDVVDLWIPLVATLVVCVVVLAPFAMDVKDAMLKQILAIPMGIQLEINLITRMTYWEKLPLIWDAILDMILICKKSGPCPNTK